MGEYDEEDDGFNVKMMAKPGAQAPGEMGEAQAKQAQQTRGALAESDMDRRNAKLGWEDALRQNIGIPIQNATGNVVKGIDRMLGAPPPPAVKPNLPTGHVNVQATEDLYDRIMQERQRMLEQGLDPNAPEQMNTFQKLRESLLKRGG